MYERAYAPAEGLNSVNTVALSCVVAPEAHPFHSKETMIHRIIFTTFFILSLGLLSLNERLLTRMACSLSGSIK